MPTPPMIAVLTDIGAAAINAAHLGGQPVRLVSAALGSAAHAMTGHEAALVQPIATAPISASTVNNVERRIDLGLVFEASQVAADHDVRELGVFDELGRLIFYWSTDQGSIGALTPRSDYLIALSVTLATVPLSAIEIIDRGAPLELILEPRVIALERRSIRNLFLALNA
ncbi:hypothetical protein [uncultured Brevundimonas sp.]|uniref:hypothetical protein n=1 Tax=uncultured Brevundimonas sp. TaxID=213418 RepID=UPI0025E79F13|nr:hypothetical protein [uncultured Brevundimonas sp.]